MARIAAISLAAALLALVVPRAALAEPCDPSLVTVKGPGNSQGTAGCGSGGTSASAGGSSNSQGSGGQGTSQNGGPPLIVSPAGGVTGGASGGPGGGVLCNPGNTCNNPAPALGPLGTPAAPPPNPLVLAEQALANEPWPRLNVGVNPGTGLTGLASLFWMGGGSTVVPDASASAGGLTVTVHAALADVAWSFGDGGGADSGADVGQPYPATSRIQHVYQTDTFGDMRGYTITTTLLYDVTYSVNGGQPIPLGTRALPFTTSYIVDQLQPQGVQEP